MKKLQKLKSLFLVLTLLNAVAFMVATVASSTILKLIFMCAMFVSLTGWFVVVMEMVEKQLKEKDYEKSAM